jgi:uncharacterized protein (UPF0303 family)
MSTPVPELEALLAGEARLVFPHFDHQTAWDLGSAMHARALAGQLPVVISIRRNGRRPFHSSYYKNGRTSTFRLQAFDPSVARKGPSVTRRAPSRLSITVAELGSRGRRRRPSGPRPQAAR